MRAAVNDWIMSNFPQHRQYLYHEQPVFNAVAGGWEVTLGSKVLSNNTVNLGRLLVDGNGDIVQSDTLLTIIEKIERLLHASTQPQKEDSHIHGDRYQFFCGDGIEGAKLLANESIALLLTDPPYGISQAYVCETQVPRRLRADGRDFIMPKGNFGNWDKPIKPEEWLDIVLPKVGGWFVSFCAQAQIGAYQDCLRRHKFVAVGTLVWQKTNPVPFNHRFKPINAWEAIVVGKRSGTKFYGDGVIHNLFKCKSPPPQARVHPTQKPLELICQFVALFSQKNDLVFDPFAGSATTLIAAAGLERDALGYEAESTIFETACKRIKREHHAN